MDAMSRWSAETPPHHALANPHASSPTASGLVATAELYLTTGLAGVQSAHGNNFQLATVHDLGQVHTPSPSLQESSFAQAHWFCNARALPPH